MTEVILQILGAPCGKNFFGMPVWYKYLSQDAGSGFCTEVSFGGIYDVFKILAAVIEIALRLGALVAVGFIIFAGIQYITSQGDPEGITRAKDTLINAIIGLVITLLATTIISIIVGRFSGQ